MSTTTSIINNCKKIIVEYYYKEKPYICHECGNDGIWNNKELVLQMDHINGNKEDHSFDNLRFLCPNCHTKTLTHSVNKNSYEKYKDKDKDFREIENMNKIANFQKKPKPIKDNISIENITIDEILATLEKVKNLKSLCRSLKVEYDEKNTKKIFNILAKHKSNMLALNFLNQYGL